MEYDLHAQQKPPSVPTPGPTTPGDKNDREIEHSTPHVREDEKAR